jgi:hypothetical protein
MNAEIILKKLRVFLLGFSIFIFAGALFELAFLNHLGEDLQFMPFVLGPLGIILAALMILKPSSKMVKAVRVGMWAILVGGIIGMIVHVSGNLEFLEGGQGASFGEIIKNAFGGRNPLLAPGILSMSAVIALAALYKHPLETK